MIVLVYAPSVFASEFRLGNFFGESPLPFILTLDSQPDDISGWNFGAISSRTYTIGEGTTLRLQAVADDGFSYSVFLMEGSHRTTLFEGIIATQLNTTHVFNTPGVFSLGISGTNLLTLQSGDIFLANFIVVAEPDLPTGDEFLWDMENWDNLSEADRLIVDAFANNNFGAFDNDTNMQITHWRNFRQTGMMPDAFYDAFVAEIVNEWQMQFGFGHATNVQVSTLWRWDNPLEATHISFEMPGGFHFTMHGNMPVLYRYSGAGGEVTLPQLINAHGQIITYIVDSSMNYSLVVLDSGIIQQLVIPDGTAHEIEAHAFSDGRIVTVTIPGDGRIQVHSNAFARTTTIYIQEGSFASTLNWGDARVVIVPEFEAEPMSVSVDGEAMSAYSIGGVAHVGLTALANALFETDYAFSFAFDTASGTLSLFSTGGVASAQTVSTLPDAILFNGASLEISARVINDVLHLSLPSLIVALDLNVQQIGGTFNIIAAQDLDEPVEEDEDLYDEADEPQSIPPQYIPPGSSGGINVLVVILISLGSVLAVGGGVVVFLIILKKKQDSAVKPDIASDDYDYEYDDDNYN